VAQFSGYAAEHSAYAHGEVSLQGTIVNMAQNFVGASNINWLVPSGQFGTRLAGGKDSASARYIFTRLSPETRRIFPPSDDPLLAYNEDDGDSIEPTYYVPVVPALLINGSSGIGTGFSTDVPAYNPRDIVDNVRRMIRGEDPVPMTPWYRGFKGTIRETSPGVFVTTGMCAVSGKTVVVSELPIGVWTNTYKEFLEGLVEKRTISDFREKHAEQDVLFEIDFVGVPDVGVLKLESALRTTNMHALDPDGRIQKYESPLDILRAWFDVRKKLYSERKRRMLEDLAHRCAVAKNKHRFISMVNDGILVINKKSEDVLDKELDDMKFTRVKSSFDYLLSMKISSLTAERAAELEKESGKIQGELDVLKDTCENAMWIRDLDYCNGVC
jgi:DNA topoisomerase-2